MLGRGNLVDGFTRHAFWVVDEVGWISVAGMVVGGGSCSGHFYCGCIGFLRRDVNEE